jgi:hypothetical protein
MNIYNNNNSIPNFSVSLELLIFSAIPQSPNVHLAFRPVKIEKRFMPPTQTGRHVWRKGMSCFNYNSVAQLSGKEA